MPPIELQARFEDAVLWPLRQTKKYDDYGEPIVDEDYIELKVQWVGVKGQMVDPNGNVITTDAQVVVDRDIEIGSRMWKGHISEWTGTGSGDVDDEVYKVVAFNFQKDIKGRMTRRTVGLQRWRDDPDPRA